MAIDISDDKSWEEDKKDLLNHYIEKFYGLLSIPEDLKEQIIELYSVKYRNQYNDNI